MGEIGGFVRWIGYDFLQYSFAKDEKNPFVLQIV